MADHVVGIAWYFPDEWLELRSSARDPDVLEATYEQWLEVYRDGVERLRATGMRPRRVAIHVKELLAWCDRHRRGPDAAARAAYAAEALERATHDGIQLPDA